MPHLPLRNSGFYSVFHFPIIVSFIGLLIVNIYIFIFGEAGVINQEGKYS